MKWLLASMVSFALLQPCAAAAQGGGELQCVLDDGTFNPACNGEAHEGPKQVEHDDSLKAPRVITSTILAGGLAYASVGIIGLMSIRSADCGYNDSCGPTPVGTQLAILGVGSLFAASTTAVTGKLLDGNGSFLLSWGLGFLGGLPALAIRDDSDSNMALFVTAIAGMTLGNVLGYELTNSRAKAEKREKARARVALGISPTLHGGATVNLHGTW